MISITVDGTTETSELLARLRAGLTDMSPAMETVGMLLVRRVSKRFQSGGGWPRSVRAAREGGRTMMMTGRLRASIGSRSMWSGVFDVQKRGVVVGTNVAYARLMQEGGIVRAKGNGALPIPLNKEARRAQALVRSVRAIPDLTYIPRKGKPPLLVKIKSRQTKGGATILSSVRFEPWFVLLRSVRIPPRPFLTVDDANMPEIERAIRRHLQSLIAS